MKLTSPILDNIYNFQQSWESQFHSISTNNQISPISILYCITIQIHVNTNQPLPLPGRGTPPASVTLGTRSVGTTWSSYTAASLSGPSSPTHPRSSYSSHLQRKQENMCDCRQICVDETVLNRMKRNCIYEKNLQQSRTYFQSFEMLFE